MWQQQWNIILTHIFDHNWVGCPLDVVWPLVPVILRYIVTVGINSRVFMKQKVLKSFPGLGQPCGGLNESQSSTAWFLEVGGLPAFRVTLLA